MNNIISAIFQAAVLFVTNLILIFVVDSFSADKGSLFKVGNIEVAGKSYAQYIIRNQSETAISGVIFTIPENISIDEIKSNSPLLISSQQPSADKKFNTYKLDQIQAMQDTSILIPITGNDMEPVRFMNSKEVGLGNVQSSPKSKIQESILTPIINSILISILLIYSKHKTNELREKSIKSHDELRQEIDKLRENSKLIDLNSEKMKVLLIAKIADYRKELDFWRLTATSALGNPQESKTWAEHVSTRLKTYSTTDARDDVDLEYIKVAANLIGRVDEK